MEPPRRTARRGSLAPEREREAHSFPRVWCSAAALEASPRPHPTSAGTPPLPKRHPCTGKPGGTRAARRLKVHRQPRTHRGEPDGAPHARTRRPGRERRKKGSLRQRRGGRTRGPHATAPDIPKRLHLGGRRRPRPPATPQPRRTRERVLRLMAKRPSDRRSPGRNPGPQGAFEVSMINVSCNSH